MLPAIQLVAGIGFLERGERGREREEEGEGKRGLERERQLEL